MPPPPTTRQRLHELQSQLADLLRKAQPVNPPLPPSLELRSLSLYRAALLECLSTLVYVFLVTSVCIPWTGHYPPFLSVALVTGLGYYALTLALFKDCYMNPAFVLAERVRGRLTTVRGVMLLVGECGGAVAGAAVVYGLSTPGYQGNLGSTLPSASIEPLQAAGVEFILSIVLTLTFMLEERQGRLGTSCVLLAGSLVAIPSSGGSLNPARSLGPAFVMNRWKAHWVYWVGPGGGALAGAYLYTWLLGRGFGKEVDEEEGEVDGTEGCGEREVDRPVDRLLQMPTPATITEPLYNGTRSLYMKPSPLLPRAGLARSQSVYASRKCFGTPGGGRKAMRQQPAEEPVYNQSDTFGAGLLTTGAPFDSSLPAAALSDTASRGHHHHHHHASSCHNNAKSNHHHENAVSHHHQNSTASTLTSRVHPQYGDTLEAHHHGDSHRQNRTIGGRDDLKPNSADSKAKLYSEQTTRSPSPDPMRRTLLLNYKEYAGGGSFKLDVAPPPPLPRCNRRPPIQIPVEETPLLKGQPGFPGLLLPGRRPYEECVGGNMATAPERLDSGYGNGYSGEYVAQHHHFSNH